MSKNRALLVAVSVLSVIGSSVSAAAAEPRPSMVESRAVFVEDTADCPDTLAEQTAIFEELFSQGEPTLEAWADALYAYLPLAEAQISCVAAIEPPEKLHRAHADFLAAIGIYMGLQQDAAAAAAAGDAATFYELADAAQGQVKWEVIRTARLLGIGDWFA